MDHRADRGPGSAISVMITTQDRDRTHAAGGHHHCFDRLHLACALRFELSWSLSLPCSAWCSSSRALRRRSPNRRARTRRRAAHRRRRPRRRRSASCIVRGRRVMRRRTQRRIERGSRPQRSRRRSIIPRRDDRDARSPQGRLDEISLRPTPSTCFAIGSRTAGSPTKWNVRWACRPFAFGARARPGELVSIS